MSLRRNRRRRPLGTRLAEMANALGGGLSAIVKAATVLALTAALPVGLYLGYQALMRSDYFIVSAIRIQGAERLSRSDVLAIAGLEGRQNIFALDTDSIAERLEANAWVVSARVELDLPRTVDIRVVERQPAGWLYWGALYRIDGDGHVIEVSAPDAIDGPLVTGVEAVQGHPEDGDETADESLESTHLMAAERVRQALAIGRLYESNGLNDFDELAEIHYDELLGFSLLTRRHAMEVRLGHEDFLTRLLRLRDVLMALDDRELTGRYMLLDTDGGLSRVAVGPLRPGRGAGDPEALEPALPR